MMEYGLAPFNTFMEAVESAEKELTEVGVKGNPPPDSYFVIELPQQPWQRRDGIQLYGWYAHVGRELSAPVPEHWTEVLWGEPRG